MLKIFFCAYKHINGMLQNLVKINLMRLITFKMCVVDVWDLSAFIFAGIANIYAHTCSCYFISFPQWLWPFYLLLSLWRFWILQIVASK